MKKLQNINKQQTPALRLGAVSNSLVFKDLTTLTLTKASDCLMLDIRDGNTTNTKCLNKKQIEELKIFLNCG